MILDKPLVSVLMTAYNREKYIAEAIESVLASSFTNYELIIVDDCSKDSTVEIAKRYEAKDKRIRVYCNEENQGDYTNRNTAASYAKGKYIKYVDSDDIIYSNSLSIFVNGMEQFPDAAVGIMSSKSQDDKPFPYLMQPSEAYNYHFYLGSLFDTGPSAIIFKADRFREIGGFSGKRYVGDTEINLRLAARWPIVKIASSLVFWRQHDGQEFVSGTDSTGYLELLLPMYREELNKQDIPLSENQKRSILRYFSKISTRQLLSLALVQKQPLVALRLFSHLSLSPMNVLDAVLFINKKY